MRKKSFFTVSTCIAIMGLASLQLHSRLQENSYTTALMAENVEALSETEYATETTWSCSNVPLAASCAAKCAVCGTSINGHGTLTGSHKCNIITD